MRLVSGLVILLCGVGHGAEKFDLVVYGGTAGGVITAVAAAREGVKVVLLEPGRHLGGMATGGLSRTDYGRKEVIGGYALEFYWRVGDKYEMRRFGQDAAWYYEPKVGEQVFHEMLAEVGVTVRKEHRLREKTGVRREGALLREIIMENGASFEGLIFADCTYEGDLMAQAGVSYTWGRESADQYGESLAGFRERTPYHQFTVDVSAYDEAGRLLPEVGPGKRERPGQGDKRVQAYNFRLILSDDPNNQIPFPKPPGYDPARYELLARLLKALTEKEGRAPRLNEVTLIAPIPNRKADFNNRGAFSTDYIGKNYDYPEAGYSRRAEIVRDHIYYTQGFFYFLASDPRVPADLQREVRQWGLAKDEFTDTGGWPHQLYVREARRMVGEYVMTQKDIQTEVTKPDAIGMGSYNSDSHNVQRFANERGFAENEGDMQVPVKPYHIPYRVMLPKRSEATNLLVPVCVSASHVAYSTLRMEPQYMIMGQAAGVAAAMAISTGRALHDLDVRALQQKLLEQGVVLEYHPAPPRPRWKGYRQKIQN